MNQYDYNDGMMDDIIKLSKYSICRHYSVYGFGNYLILILTNFFGVFGIDASLQKGSLEMFKIFSMRVIKDPIPEEIYFKAGVYFQFLSSLEEKAGSAYSDIAKSYRLGNFEGVISCIRERFLPDALKNYFFTAISLYSLGKYEEGIKYIDNIIETSKLHCNQKTYHIYLILALCHERVSNFKAFSLTMNTISSCYLFKIDIDIADTDTKVMHSVTYYFLVLSFLRVSDFDQFLRFSKKLSKKLVTFAQKQEHPILKSLINFFQHVKAFQASPIPFETPADYIIQVGPLALFKSLLNPGESDPRPRISETLPIPQIKELGKKIYENNLRDTQLKSNFCYQRDIMDNLELFRPYPDTLQSSLDSKDSESQMKATTFSYQSRSPKVPNQIKEWAFENNKTFPKFIIDTPESQESSTEDSDRCLMISEVAMSSLSSYHDQNMNTKRKGLVIVQDFDYLDQNTHLIEKLNFEYIILLKKGEKDWNVIWSQLHRILQLLFTKYLSTLKNPNQNRDVSAYESNFFRVFKNMVIRKKIFSFVTTGAPGTYSYEKIPSMKWIFKNRKFGLLKDKILKKQEYQCEPPDQEDILALCKYHNDLELFIYFFRYQYYFQTFRLVDIVAAQGSLDILRFLFITEIDFYGKTGVFEWATTDAIDLAAKNGHLDVIKFLHTARKEGCTHKAIDYAARNGHLDVVQFLTDQQKPCTQAAMNYAARNGHFQVVDYLNKHRKEGCDKSAMDFALINGHTEIANFLFNNRSEKFTSNDPTILQRIALKGNIDSFNFFITHSNLTIPQNILDFAVKSGNLEMVKIIIVKHNIQPTFKAIDNAAEYGFLDIVKYLNEFHPKSGCSIRAIDDAAKNGHLQVVEYLHRHRGEGCSSLAYDNAVEFNHLDIVKFLHHNRPERGTSLALLKAVRTKNLKLIKFVCEENKFDISSQFSVYDLVLKIDDPSLRIYYNQTIIHSKIIQSFFKGLSDHYNFNSKKTYHFSTSAQVYFCHNFQLGDLSLTPDFVIYDYHSLSIIEFKVIHKITFDREKIEQSIAQKYAALIPHLKQELKISDQMIDIRPVVLNTSEKSLSKEYIQSRLGPFIKNPTFYGFLENQLRDENPIPSNTLQNQN